MKDLILLYAAYRPVALEFLSMLRGKFGFRFYILQKQRSCPMTGGIVEIDVHGMNGEQAKEAIEKKIYAAGSSVYRVRVIHGFHGGTRLRAMIREEFDYGREPKVKRIEMGTNPGITELVLREF